MLPAHALTVWDAVRAGLATLLDMGYSRNRAQRALDDAKGVVETAAIMLMSADEIEETGGAVDPATGVDLANVVEGGRTRSRRD